MISKFQTDVDVCLYFYVYSYISIYIEAFHRLLCFRMAQADARHSTLVQCTMHI
jgi:hypothetical protein